MAAAAAGKSGPNQAMDTARSVNFGESLFMQRESHRSLAPTTVWKDRADPNGGGVIDPQIAVCSNIVAVLTWGTLASYYYKSRTRVPSTLTFPNPVQL